MDVFTIPPEKTGHNVFALLSKIRPKKQLKQTATLLQQNKTKNN